MAKNGNPNFHPTAAQRDQVAWMAADGMPIEQIAAVLGLCRQTVSRHFVDEITNGKARKRVEVMTMLRKAAKKGNVTAQKYLAMRIDGHPVPGLPHLGKKEQAALEAQTAHEGTEWQGLMERFDRLN